jgi:hypothetical protein
MGTRVEQINDIPHRWRATFWCDRCPLESHWTFELTAPEGHTAGGLARRLAQEASWHVSNDNEVTCPACVGMLLEPPAAELHEELYRSPVNFGLSLVTPIRQITAAIAQGRPAPAADDFYRLGCQALSRSYPAEPQGLRDALGQLQRQIDSLTTPLVPMVGYEPSTLEEIEIRGQDGRRFTISGLTPDDLVTMGDYQHPTSVTITIGGKLAGVVPLREAPKIELKPPKSSWERLMEDDVDECP